MLVLIQSRDSIRELDVINLDVENPSLGTEDQKYVLVGFNAAYGESGIILGTFDNKSKGTQAMTAITDELKHGSTNNLIIIPTN